MAKTIKQIADELGVSKQKVYRFIVKNHITASSEVMQSKLYDDVAERLIKSHFDHITTSSERCGDAHQKINNDVLLEQLIKELETKNEQIREKDRQLAEKDRQLNAVNEMLAENQRLLDQQQQLNALAEQKLLLLEEKKEEPEKKHWWQFGRKWDE
jgi:DNA primase